MIKDIALMSENDRDDLIRIATQDFQEKQKLSLYEALIEKDFWVTFMLKIIFQDANFKNDFEFKGGTSLSKGFNAINRFSDVNKHHTKQRQN